MGKIRLLVVDDHTMVRQGFCCLLRHEENIEIVGEAENGRQAVKLAKKLVPDVILMDIVMPILNGLEATRQIARFVPTSKVLAVSAHSDDDYGRPSDAEWSGWLFD